MSARIRSIHSTNKPGDSVVYWMTTQQRVQDNPALSIAQKIANETGKELIVVFAIYQKSKKRAQAHFKFMVEGLEQVERSLNDLNIKFDVVDNKDISSHLNDLNPDLVILDHSSLRAQQIRHEITQEFDTIEVDGRNLIPVWELSDKEEFAAHTIRPKVHKFFMDFVNESYQLEKQEKALENANDWDKFKSYTKNYVLTDSELIVKSGEEQAIAVAREFANNMSDYHKTRNDMTNHFASKLSAYLHFGQIYIGRVIREILDANDMEASDIWIANHKTMPKSDRVNSDIQASVDHFVEEAVVRRELADNFCFYNKNYDQIKGAKDWAKQTLSEHADDPREHIYSYQQLNNAETHDDAWNAAQTQLRRQGYMHGYMRMYWAKKILEWTESPKQALEYAIKLNDLYNLDGADPNGYTGVMWSIAGVHDRAWTERAVFGKIRYMNYAGLKRKFDIQEYERAFS